MIVLVQSSFHTIWASLFEMELEPNSLDWNGNKLEHKLELEDMKRTKDWQTIIQAAKRKSKRYIYGNSND